MSYAKMFGLVIVNALVAGSLTGATLETKLAGSDYRTGWQWVVTNAARMDALAANQAASQAMADSTTALTDVANTSAALNRFALNGNGAAGLLAGSACQSVIFGDAARYANFVTAATQSGSKIKRQDITSSTTWTKPTTLKAICVMVIGGGGNGGSGVTGAGGGGGGGAETKAKVLDPAAVTGNVTVTIAGAAGTTSFGSHLSAVGGSNGGNGSGGVGGAAGPGGSSEAAAGALTDIPDARTANMRWVFGTVIIPGASGGARGAGSNAPNADGQGNSTGYGIGGSFESAFTPEIGGGGGASPYGNGGNGATSPTAGTGNGAGGGGRRGSGSGGGATGSPGRCIVMWVEA